MEETKNVIFEQKLPTNIGSLPARLQRKILKESEINCGVLEGINNSGLTSSSDIKLAQRENVNQQAESKNVPNFFQDARKIDYLKESNQCKMRPKPSDNIKRIKNSQHILIPGILPIPNSDQFIHTDEEMLSVNSISFNWDNHVPKWFALLNKRDFNSNLVLHLKQLHLGMYTMMQKGKFLKDWCKYMNIRKEVETIFVQLLLKALKFCCKQNVEQYFWKILYYNVIEMFKKILNSDGPNLVNIKSKALELIEEGLEFYKNLLSLLENQYNFELKLYFNNSKNGTTNKQKLESLALVSAQKILINLGDLSRYKEQILKTQNYDCAMQYYQKAQILLPTNGIPYNQMAILALYSRKNFDAIYYHMRSLVASNPICSAKESLNSLYDEIRKKHDEFLQQSKLLELSIERKCSELSFTPLRKEIWVNSDGSLHIHRMYKDNSDFLLKLSPTELKKQFISSFLYVHGKLFSGVGMENFTENALQMLMEFRTMLDNNSYLFSKSKLLKIVSLNIFSIDFNNKNGLKELRKEIRNNAMNVGHFMFGIIIDRANELLKELFSLKDYEMTSVLKLDSNTSETYKPIASEVICQHFSNNLICLLQAIKIWCNWLSLSMDIWVPSSFQMNSTLAKTLGVEPWKHLACLTTILYNIKTTLNFCKESTKTDFMHLKLEEDVLLTGFAPLGTTINDVILYTKFDDPKIVEIDRRIEEILNFCSTILCDCSPPIFKIVEYRARKVFYNICPNSNEITESVVLEKSELFDDLNKDISSFSFESSNISKDDNNDNQEINMLLKRKYELEKRHKMQENYQQKLQNILRITSVNLHIEVRPKYLVPDTNCFIDFLDKLKIVAKHSERFSLLIPVVVLNELEGLSRGIRSSGNSPLLVTPVSDGPLDAVAKRSKEALEFIRSKNCLLKCVTTKGSVLNSCIFTFEDNEDEQISNDDKILTTALNLCKSNKQKDEGDILYIETQVVLLTTDRNLRVKALSRNLSVSRLPEFLNWARLKN